MRQSPVQQALQAALALVCVATVAYYASGVDWSYAYKSKSLLGATFTFCCLTLLALCPYSLLWQLLRAQFRPWLKLLSFALVVAPTPLLFAVWRNMEGWSFFLVPLVQFLVALSLLFLAARFNHARSGAPT